MATTAKKTPTRSPKPRTAKLAKPAVAAVETKRTASPLEQFRANLKSRFESLRGQVERQINGNAPMKRLRDGAQQFQHEADAAMTAARKDYEHAKKLVRGLRDKSAIRAFVQSKFKSASPAH